MRTTAITCLIVLTGALFTETDLSGQTSPVRRFTPDPVSIARVVLVASGRTRVDLDVTPTGTALHLEADSVVITSSAAGIELRTSGRTTVSARGADGELKPMPARPIRLLIPPTGPPEWLVNSEPDTRPAR